MRFLFAAFLVISSAALAQNPGAPSGPIWGPPTDTLTNNLKIATVTNDQCIGASIRSTGEVSINWTCVDDMARLYKPDAANDPSISIAYLLRAVRDRTFKEMGK